MYVLENMKNNGARFRTASIEEWLDCGNKEAVVYANQRVLEFNKGVNMVAESARVKNSVIIQPCYIGENVVLTDSIIGPHVSVGKDCVIDHSVVVNSVVGDETVIKDANLSNSMIGNFVEYIGRKSELSISDYSKYVS